MNEQHLFWPADVAFGEIVYPPGGSFGPRRQRHLQLVLIHSGSMRVWIDEQPRDAPTGTASVLLPDHDERFAFAADRSTHHSWIHLAVPDLPITLRERLAVLPWPLPLSGDMAALMRSLFAARRASLPTTAEICKAIAVQMIWLYIGEDERLSVAGTRSPQPPAIELARRFIAEHLHESLTLAQIADSAAVSPAHLIRLFRAHAGLTPMAYLWQQRVEHGVELLKQTGLTVHEIAMACGFQTSYHFSRRVKAVTGLSPRAIRQRAWRH